MVSNKLYMRDRHAGACSGAFVLYCSTTWKKARYGSVKLQVKSDNYRGELLGVVGFLLVIRAVLSYKKCKSLLLWSNGKPTRKAYSDCCSVNIHRNDPEKNLLKD